MEAFYLQLIFASASWRWPGVWLRQSLDSRSPPSGPAALFSSYLFSRHVCLCCWRVSGWRTIRSPCREVSEMSAVSLCTSDSTMTCFPKDSFMYCVPVLRFAYFFFRPYFTYIWHGGQFAATGETEWFNYNPSSCICIMHDSGNLMTRVQVSLI